MNDRQTHRLSRTTHCEVLYEALTNVRECSGMDGAWKWFRAVSHTGCGRIGKRARAGWRATGDGKAADPGQEAADANLPVDRREEPAAVQVPFCLVDVAVDRAVDRSSGLESCCIARMLLPGGRGSTIAKPVCLIGAFPRSSVEACRLARSRWAGFVGASSKLCHVDR